MTRVPRRFKKSLPLSTSILALVLSQLIITGEMQDYGRVPPRVDSHQNNLRCHQNNSHQNRVSQFEGPHYCFSESGDDLSAEGVLEWKETCLQGSHESGDVTAGSQHRCSDMPFAPCVAVPLAQHPNSGCGEKHAAIQKIRIEEQTLQTRLLELGATPSHADAFR